MALVDITAEILSQTIKVDFNLHQSELHHPEEKTIFSTSDKIVSLLSSITNHEILIQDFLSQYYKFHKLTEYIHIYQKWKYYLDLYFKDCEIIIYKNCSINDYFLSCTYETPPECEPFIPDIHEISDTNEIAKYNMYTENLTKNSVFDIQNKLNILKEISTLINMCLQILKI